MRIKSISVNGYRRFQNQTINLEALSTVVAGANNSGKTSFVDLLRVVLNGDGSLSVDDLNVSDRVKWTEALVTAAIKSEEAYLALVNDQGFASRCPSVELRIEVDYDPVKDDIRQFANYLMDLDDSKHSFFFIYKYVAKPDILVKLHKDIYLEIQKAVARYGWSNFDGIERDSSPSLKLHALVDKCLSECFSAQVFFSDGLYVNTVALDSVRDFTKLFNFRSIKASRKLDDTNDDNTGGLNKRLVAVAKEDKKWAKILLEFPDKVIEAIDDTDIREVTSKETLRSLNDVIQSVSSTNGTAQSDLFVDFQISEEHAIQLISRAMQTRYLGEGVSLGEGSQGLGYSNLIYLHLEAESFIRAAATSENSLLVNLLIVEEPESHMHPQMQNAFVKHLYSRINESGEVQALVTTHSNEIIRSSEVTQLRVLRLEDNFCKIIDLRDFHQGEVAGKTTEIQRLFSFLYSINFSDVLFADKVIMYEGDTERMFIQALIAKQDDLSRLRTQYISYVQVGGAYAHIYKPLIVDALKLKTVIVTDLDYEKESTTSSTEQVRALMSTNTTLNAFFGAEEGRTFTNPCVGDLYDLLTSNEDLAEVGDAGLLAVAYQTDVDGHARTFEEAILAKLLATEVWTVKSENYWKTYREESSLKFSIPRSKPSSIREIIASTSSNKTDFMYSLLLKEDFNLLAPSYILKALKWLDS